MGPPASRWSTSRLGRRLTWQCPRPSLQQQPLCANVIQVPSRQRCAPAPLLRNFVCVARVRILPIALARCRACAVELYVLCSLGHCGFAVALMCACAACVSVCVCARRAAAFLLLRSHASVLARARAGLCDRCFFLLVSIDAHLCVVGTILCQLVYRAAQDR